MKQTLEVRWFYGGPPPESVVDWFTALAPARASTREDRYLIGTDPAMNVKLRAGALQIKRRRARTPVAFGNEARGYSECWQKWSFPLAGEVPDLSQGDASGLWRPVKKTRAQHRYSPAKQRALLPSLEETTRTDVRVELTRVQSGPHAAWTICIEAEGRTATPKALHPMIRHVFQQGHLPPLDEQHSHGYVRWLNRLYA